MTLPSYYSSLAHFRDFFQEGIPILNYHMIASIPSHKKLKGLYTPQKNFNRQLEELFKSGFTSTSLTQILSAIDNSQKKIVISFDDGFQSVFEHAMKTLAQFRFQAIQFLIPKFFGKTNEWDLVLGTEQLPLMDTAQIRDWLAAGHEIGSHTLTHPYLTRLSKQQAREEISSSKKYLEDTFGVKIDHFCYPYGDCNEHVRGLVIEAGYSSACTIRFGVNTKTTDPFNFCRIKGRHPTRKIRSIWNWIKKME